MLTTVSQQPTLASAIQHNCATAFLKSPKSDLTQLYNLNLRGDIPSRASLAATVPGCARSVAALFHAPNPSSHVMVRRRSPEVIGWGRS